ncbi:GGDEF/EAL domain-containing response regulator [Acetobacter conturbans]|uniref:EAL domain-containing protein n=1 Tax=Acetobacter conturbans TaxID=1737472 RepID=A0ABX0JZK8_9PROT|nr:EAL domain-containing protein [Acetobacter conturbans]NHN88781.1 EAL domain-containing protein [Acetobacter conturbans]
MKLIAIVDDHATDRTVFERLVREISPDAQIAAFASLEDIQCYCTERGYPDLMIVVCGRSGRNVCSFLTALREHEDAQGMPVIVATASKTPAFRLKMLQAGATECFTLPVEEAEFLPRARNWLRLGESRSRALVRIKELEQKEEASHRARTTLFRDSHKRLLEVIDLVPALIGATDREGRYVFANRCMAEALGTTPEQLTRRETASDEVANLFPDGQFWRRYEKTIRDAKGRERVLLVAKTPLYSSASEMPLALVTALDITDLKAAQKTLQFLAYHDQLTGAPNRLKVEEQISRLLTCPEDQCETFALFLLDLDRFKAINDTLGHRMGDRLLRSVLSRLRENFPKAYVIGRLGGDEFAIVHPLDPHNCEEEARRTARLILECFEMPFGIGGTDDNLTDDTVVITTVSIGIVIQDKGDETFDGILKCADMAMYKAKSGGGNGYRLYNPAMERVEAVAMQIEQGLHHAVCNDSLVLHYQPQVDLRSGRITGVEALLRWKQPDGSLLPPMQFLPIAEETGQIVPITSWVLEEACTQLARWNHAGLDIRMAVNLSGVLFARTDVHTMVMAAIERHKVNPAQLELELTESVLIRRAKLFNRQLEKLRQLGVAVAVDDFGTGYASLSYLSRLVIDRIKFDKSFIDRLEHNQTDQTIVRSMIMLCRNLGIRIIAEGIERPEQARWLARHRCEEGQGFYFGKPMEAAQIAGLVRASLPGWQKDGNSPVSEEKKTLPPVRKALSPEAEGRSQSRDRGPAPSSDL